VTPRRRLPLPGSVVLLSGGMDSATCLAIASRRHRPVHALTILYGQRHDREVRSARALARHFRAARHTVLTLPLRPLLTSSLTDPRRPLPNRSRTGGRIPSTYVPARNTILLSIAMGYAESHRLGRVYLGANAIDYSGYPDCRPEYFRAFERLARVATKAAVEMMMKTMAQEAGPYGVRVLSIAPGAVATPINAGVLNDKAWQDDLMNKVPLKRIGQPEDIASVALFLASDQASYVTATTVFVDGGMTDYPAFAHGG